jgi:hypothetical protein
MSAKIPQWVTKTKIEYDNNPKVEYQNLQEGNNEVEIDMTKPCEEIEGKFNKRMKYYLINGKILTVPMGLDRQIIERLAQGITKFTILRIGKEKDSRYKVL